MAADLFWAYWDTSLRFGILALLLLLATPLLKKWISPQWLCWAWAALILRLSVPLAFPYSGSIFNLSERLQPSNWTNAIRSGVVDAGWGETLVPYARSQDEFVRSSLIGFSWEEALLLVWLSGVFVLLVGLVINAVRLRRFFNKATRHNSGRLYEIFKDTRHRFQINANVPLLVSDEVESPGIAGIFNPRVVIPRSCAEELSDTEIRCVLLHELTHYRRGDLFVHHALLLISFLHWYNPLVWLVMRQYKNTMEQACDADVVDSECIETAQEYGFTLLNVMKRSQSRKIISPAGALCLLGNKKTGALKERIHLIARPRGKNPVFAALGMGLFGVSLMFAITGEEIVEKEAERLFSLTRFSGPALLVSPVTDSNSMGFVPERYFVVDQYIARPQGWVQDIDVSELQGQKVIVRIRFELDGSSDSVDFWVNTRSSNNLIVATSKRDSVAIVGSSIQEIEMPLHLPNSAQEIVYGLMPSAAGELWVKSIEVVPES